jgi:SAM-dependent methyltransferase
VAIGQRRRRGGAALDVIGIDDREAERVAAAVAEHLPPSLTSHFGPGFTRSHTMFDEFVYRHALRVVDDTGLAGAMDDWCRVEDTVTRAGLEPNRSVIPVDWLLRHLASRGALARADGAGGPRFRLEAPLPALDPAEVLEAQRRHDPACLPSYVLAETAARDYPAFLRGERAGEDVLLAPARLPLWTGYFSNDNALYAINNRVGAAALAAHAPPGDFAVLELGGGLASGTLAALDHLAAAGRAGDVTAYRFTELVPAFLRRAQRLVTERCPQASIVSFAGLDMNRPFQEQGVAPGSVGIVYAVNTLHVARDLPFTLAEIRKAVAPGGRVIASECVRPSAGQTLYPEFVFNLLETFRAPVLDPRHRPNGGFLTPEQWTAALEASGFVDARVWPDVPRIRQVFPTFFVGAISASRPR